MAKGRKYFVNTSIKAGRQKLGNADAWGAVKAYVQVGVKRSDGAMDACDSCNLIS